MNSFALVALFTELKKKTIIHLLVTSSGDSRVSDLDVGLDLRRPVLKDVLDPCDLGLEALVLNPSLYVSASGFVRQTKLTKCL